MLRLVGIDAVHLGSYPHQLSGGMRQRAMIAMALLFTPDLVIMDEPTSALDVVAQRSLMTQIKELQRELGFAVIFVTHDMSLVSHYSDRLVVMYAGQVAEAGPTRRIFDTPAAPLLARAARGLPRHPGGQGPAAGASRARRPISPSSRTDAGSPPAAPSKLPECETTRARAARPRRHQRPLPAVRPDRRPAQRVRPRANLCSQDRCASQQRTGGSGRKERS